MDCVCFGFFHCNSHGISLLSFVVGVKSFKTLWVGRTCTCLSAGHPADYSVSLVRMYGNPSIVLWSASS